MATHLLQSITFIGGGETDGPGFRIVREGDHIKIVPVPGWDPGLMLELAVGLKVIGLAARLKTPGLAEAAVKSVAGFVEKQIGEHAGGGANVIVIRG